MNLLKLQSPSGEALRTPPKVSSTVHPSGVCRLVHGTECVSEAGRDQAGGSPPPTNMQTKAPKTHLQKYEHQTHRLVAASALITALGLYIYFAWSSAGGVLAIIGFAGLVLGFLRR